MTCRPSFSRLNSDTIGCVWMGESTLNTLQVDGDIFEEKIIRKEKVVEVVKIFTVQIRIIYIKVLTTISSGKKFLIRKRAM